jgi:hypothetical protein
MRQAIQVKFYPVTDENECERFLAQCPGGSLIVPFNYDHDHAANEILAAEALAVKMEFHLKNKLSEPGGLPDGWTVFTLIERDQYLCGNSECGREIQIVGTWKSGYNGLPLWKAQVCKTCEAEVLPVRMMGMTAEQFATLREMYAINPDGADSFVEFVKRAAPEIGFKDVFLIRWQNITVGIEADGHRHT